MHPYYELLLQKQRIYNEIAELELAALRDLYGGYAFRLIFGGDEP